MNKLKRLILLIKRDFLTGYRGVLIAMASVAGFVILVSALSNIGGENGDFHIGLFTSLLIVGGGIVTSLAFREMHLGERSYFYLTLPGSMFEKFLSKLLVTSIGYAVGTLAFYSAVALASEGINHLIFGYSHPLFNPFTVEVLRIVALYLVIQAIFLAGSAYFKKLAFLKTVLVWNLFIIGTALVAGFAAWLIFRGDYLVGGMVKPEIEILLNRLNNTGTMEAFFVKVGGGFWLALKILFWAVLAPVCWLISYFRLTEIEV